MGKKLAMAVLKLVPVVWLVMLHAWGVHSAAPEITLAPMNRTVGLGHAPLILPCHILGEDMFWLINGELYGSTNIARFRNMGITVSNPVYSTSGNQITAEARVQVSAETNNTVIVCEAQYDASLEASSPATILIADVPLSPNPTFSTVNISTVLVQWMAPFTWQDFPVTNYTVEVTNQTSGEPISRDVLDSDTLSYTMTQVDPPPCSNITFAVWANNSVGASRPGHVHGSFPVSPGLFHNPPTTEVTFSQEHVPILTINFTFPHLCFFQNATYHLIIRNSEGMVVHSLGPDFRHWTQGNSMVVIRLREPGLQLNTMYRASITVSTLAGQQAISVVFDTTIAMASTASTVWGLSNQTTAVLKINSSTGVSVVAIVSACIVTAFVMSSIALIIVGSVYMYRRNIKRTRDCINATELPMVNNPIYEGGVIYEEIPNLPCPNKFDLPVSTEQGEESYVSINPMDSPTLDKCDRGDIAKQQLVEDSYTVMNSAGPMLKTHSVEEPELVNASSNEANAVPSNKPEDRYVVIH